MKIKLLALVATLALLPSLAEAGSCRSYRSGSYTKTSCSSAGGSSSHLSYNSGSYRKTYSSGTSRGRSWSSRSVGYRSGSVYIRSF